jgi:hypothetical protein
MKALATEKLNQLQNLKNDIQLFPHSAQTYPIETRNKISKEYSDNLKSQMKRLKFQLNNSDVANYAYLFPCAIQYGLIMAYSDDKIYKDCVKNSNSEIIFFAVSAFSAFILCIYHLFKCAFIKCDLKLVDSVGDQTEVSNQNLFNTKIGAVELKNLRKSIFEQAFQTGFFF